MPGVLLCEFQKRLPGRRFTAFEALHLLCVLARGVEDIHAAGEYHGDLHDENIIVSRRGISFDVKLLDMFHWGKPSGANIRQDVVDLVQIFYTALGGQRFYARHRPEIKAICCGLKHTLINRKFPTAGHLRRYLETMTWQDEA